LIRQNSDDREIPKETEISDAETLRTKAAFSCVLLGWTAVIRLCLAIGKLLIRGKVKKV
jgi:hypothetical protein